MKKVRKMYSEKINIDWKSIRDFDFPKFIKALRTNFISGNRGRWGLEKVSED